MTTPVQVEAEADWLRLSAAARGQSLDAAFVDPANRLHPEIWRSVPSTRIWAYVSMNRRDEFDAEEIAEHRAYLDRRNAAQIFKDCVGDMSKATTLMELLTEDWDKRVGKGFNS